MTPNQVDRLIDSLSDRDAAIDKVVCRLTELVAEHLPGIESVWKIEEEGAAIYFSSRTMVGRVRVLVKWCRMAWWMLSPEEISAKEIINESYLKK